MRPVPSPVLAQSSSALDVLPWIGGLILLVIVGGALVMIVRRRLLSDPASPSQAGLAEQLRRLHADGQVSDEEYQRIRRAMADRVAGRRVPGPRTDDTAP